jgi:hypothetical protein
MLAILQAVTAVALVTTPCDAVLAQGARAYIGFGVMAEMDARAEEWAACMHVRWAAHLTDDARALSEGETVEREVLGDYRVLEQLLWLRCRCNGAGHIVARDRAFLEEDMNSWVKAKPSVGAETRSSAHDSIRTDSEWVRNRLQNPTTSDLRNAMSEERWTEDRARMEWLRTARPLLEAIEREERRSGVDVHPALPVRLRAKILRNMVTRLLGS